jgi:hypothetical protein
VAWRGAAPQAAAQRAPNQAYGYYAGYGPLAGGSGSGMGQAMAGPGQFAAGQGVTIGGQQWHPTILYLFALIVAEMVVFAFIGNVLK